MEVSKVDMFLTANNDLFPSEALPGIRSRLIAADEGIWSRIVMLQYKKPVIALIFSLFLGALGIPFLYRTDGIRRM